MYRASVIKCLAPSHSVRDHNILFDFEHIFERTLSGTEPKPTSDVALQTDLPTEPSQNLKRRRRASTESSTPDQNANRTTRKRVKRSLSSRDAVQ